jgi:transcriptional regulator of NAD metabolism
MKKAVIRRKEIVNILFSAGGAVAGAQLSARLGVSRQIIVQDINTLRNEGYEIISTHSGYVIKASPLKERVYKVYHTSEKTADELLAIVALGGTVVDVHVWHKVYGKISAVLNLFSERGVTQFIEGIKEGKSTELMHLTAGVHYHTVRAEKEETLDANEAKLDELGYLAKD